KLLRQLTKHHVEPSLVRDYGYSSEDSEVVVLLGALTHCIGMAVHREGHEDFSLFLAEPKLRELLDGIYEEPDTTAISSEVLQAKLQGSGLEPYVEVVPHSDTEAEKRLVPIYRLET